MFYLFLLLQIRGFLLENSDLFFDLLPVEVDVMQVEQDGVHRLTQRLVKSMNQRKLGTVFILQQNGQLDFTAPKNL